MAQSRLERIGTIFSRTTSLLRGGAMKQEDVPLWYAIYEAFPPKVEPCYGRSVPIIPIRNIFYKEDLVRAKFQKDHKKFLASSLTNTKNKSRTQRFISIYEQLEKSGVPEAELYSKAMDEYLSHNNAIKDKIVENAEQNQNIADRKEATNVDLKNIFAD